MAVICDYTGIAQHYEDWCAGDDSFAPVASFYLNHLAGYTGIFAELGVGTGRIARPLAVRKCVFVYGIDSCEAMLEQCRQRMTPDMNLALINASFLDFDLPQKADVIYMPFRTIGYVLNIEDLNVLFKCVSRNLKSGGVFIFDHYMFDQDWAKAHNDVDIPMFEDASTVIVDRYTYDFANHLMRCNVKRNGSTVMSFDFRLLHPNDVRVAVEGSGLEFQMLYGDFDNSAWTSDSPNHIWVLRKGM